MSSVNDSRKYEIAKAFAEVYDLENFMDNILVLSYKEMFIRVGTRDRAFIEHLQNVDKKPTNPQGFWTAYYTWINSKLALKYPDVWEEVFTLWLESDFRKRLREKDKTNRVVWSSIEQILADAYPE